MFKRRGDVIIAHLSIFIEAAMRRMILSTDDVPEADRFSYWRAAASEGLVGVSIERNKSQETPFQARLNASIGASLTRVRARSDGHPVFRRPYDIARRGWGDCVWLRRETGAGARFDQGGREFVTQPGDLLIVDPTIPFALETRANYDHDIWFFPRKLLDPHLPIAQRPRSLVLAGHDGLSGVVKPYLEAFAAQIDALDDREADLVADNFCRLLAVTCGAAAGEHKESIRAARLEEAKRYIGLHLADPELTPEKAAGALKVSVRQLHLLFEPSGTTFGQYVVRRRLEECRAALMNPISSRSVTDVAFAWGFNNLWTFNRNFRRAFGITPGEMRRDAPAPGSSG
jgi:AraC-like DNA-binding protein